MKLLNMLLSAVVADLVVDLAVVEVPEDIEPAQLQ